VQLHLLISLRTRPYTGVCHYTGAEFGWCICNDSVSSFNYQNYRVMLRVHRDLPDIIKLEEEINPFQVLFTSVYDHTVRGPEPAYHVHVTDGSYCPQSTLNSEDPFSIPRASAGIIARRYIQSEENTTQYTKEEGGMEETRKVHTPIPRKFEASDSGDSEDDAMTEVEWRDESPYMTPTKKGKKRNKGKGFRRPVTPDQPIPNMPQTPSRKKLEADWAKPAETLTNETGPVNLEAFVGEYLRNTNGLRDFMATNQLHDERYDE